MEVQVKKVKIVMTADELRSIKIALLDVRDRGEGKIACIPIKSYQTLDKLLDVILESCV